MNSKLYLESKPRYEILDGLRGVAALLVVAYHLFESYYGGGPKHPINHGYLAVDFFFALSGFVIGYAYDDRWDKMTTWGFFKRRLIRLHPLLIFASLLGALLFYFGDCKSFPLMESTSWSQLMLVMLLVFTMIPLPDSMDIRGWAETNPLNGAVWSLQWEYVANIMYALFIRRFPKWLLALCVACFALLTVILCLNIDIFGWLAVRSDASYTVIGGWSTTPDQLQIGLTRLCYPFFCGLLISRMGWNLKVSNGFVWCSLAIIALLAMPWMGMGNMGAERMTNGIYEILCILLLFPLVIMVGAGSSVKGRMQGLNKFLGDISFPLYITHYPLIYMQMSWIEKHADAPLGTHIFVSISLFILAIMLAWASFKLYDLPVRTWLRKKLFK